MYARASTLHCKILSSVRLRSFVTNLQTEQANRNPYFYQYNPYFVNDPAVC